MTSRYVLFLSLLIGFTALSCMAEECKAPTPYKNIHRHQEIVDMPGHYCLSEDVVQSSIFDIHAFSFKSLAGSSLLQISYDSQGEHRSPATGQWERNRPLIDSDVFDVDLRGYMLMEKPTIWSASATTES